MGYHFGVMLLTTPSAGQEQGQAWGVAVTTPPHAVLVH